MYPIKPVKESLINPNTHKNSVADNDRSSAIRFLEANLPKGYSQQKLSQLLSQRGFKREVIDEALSLVNPSHFEQEAISFISSIIDKHLRQGDPTDKIIAQLESKGIDHSLVTKALSGLKGERMVTPSPLPHLSQTTWIVLICVVAGILLTGVLLSFYGPDVTQPSVQDCAWDKDCFIAQANQCSPTKVREDISGSILSYQSFMDCTLTKRFESFGPAEPQEVVSFFSGKQMSCVYEPGYFPTELVQSLTSGNERCTGALKDAIEELALASLAIET